MKRTLSSLRHRDFRLFYVALVVAGVGAYANRTATLYQVYEVTGSALHLGLTGLAQAVPILALSLMGGVIADSVDRRRFIMLTQAAIGLLTLGMALVTAFGLVEVWHLYVFTLLQSGLTAVNTPARNAIIPNLVPDEDLQNALGLNSTLHSTSLLVGPALGGLSIAWLGLSTTYALNGGGYLVTLVALALMHVAPVLMRRRQGAVRSIVEGLSFVRHRSIILVLLGLDSAERFFGGYRVLLPVFAARLGAGAEGLGFLLSASAIGGLVGATTIMSLDRLRYRGLVVVGGVLGYCVMLVVLAFSEWFPVALLAVVGLGLSDAFNAVPRNVIIQRMTPNEIRGRVSSFQSMLTHGAPALGEAQSGTLAAIIGAPMALVAGAVACTVVVVGLVVKRPDLRDRDL